MEIKHRPAQDHQREGREQKRQQRAQRPGNAALSENAHRGFDLFRGGRGLVFRNILPLDGRGLFPLAEKTAFL